MFLQEVRVLPLDPTQPTEPPADITTRVWFTAAQAAEYLGYRDPKTIRRAFLDGRLQGRRTPPTTPGSRGGNLGFRREWLDRFREGLPPLNPAISPRPRAAS